MAVRAVPAHFVSRCSRRSFAAVQQDFHATVLLSNVERVVVGVAQAQLAERTAERQQPRR